MPQIVFHSPKGQFVKEPKKPELLIGSGEGCTFIIKGQRMEAYHAKFLWKAPELSIVNLSEKNPVLLNDVPLPVNEKRTLAPNDVIICGPRKFEIKEGLQPTPGTTKKTRNPVNSQRPVEPPKPILENETPDITPNSSILEGPSSEEKPDNHLPSSPQSTSTQQVQPPNPMTPSPETLITDRETSTQPIVLHPAQTSESQVPPKDSSSPRNLETSEPTPQTNPSDGHENEVHAGIPQSPVSRHQEVETTSPYQSPSKTPTRNNSKGRKRGQNRFPRSKSNTNIEAVPSSPEHVQRPPQPADNLTHNAESLAKLTIQLRTAQAALESTLSRYSQLKEELQQEEERATEQREHLLILQDQIQTLLSNPSAKSIPFTKRRMSQSHLVHKAPEPQSPGSPQHSKGQTAPSPKASQPATNTRSRTRRTAEPEKKTQSKNQTQKQIPLSPITSPPRAHRPQRAARQGATPLPAGKIWREVKAGSLHEDPWDVERRLKKQQSVSQNSFDPANDFVDLANPQVHV